MFSAWRWAQASLMLLVGASLHASPVISEFMASNDSVLADEDGAFPDWIELHNPDSNPVSLAGCHLTDDPADLQKWTLPAVALDGGGYLVIFASGKDRRRRIR